MHRLLQKIIILNFEMRIQVKPEMDVDIFQVILSRSVYFIFDYDE